MSTRIHVAEPLAVDTRLDLPESAARHVGQVLRMRAGELLTLFNGAGGEYDAVIESVERRSVRVHIENYREVERESRLELVLAQCVSKGERMDYTVQKAVELGVSTIVPLLSARSVVKLDGWLALAGNGTRLVLAPGGHHALKELPASAEATLLVGPEGGLDDKEIALAVHRGFTAIGLGPRVLRTETAGVAALSALQALWGDLG